MKTKSIVRCLFHIIRCLLIVFLCVLATRLIRQVKQSEETTSSYTSSVDIEFSKSVETIPYGIVDNESKSMDTRSLVYEKEGRTIYRPKTKNKSNPVLAAYEIEYDLPPETSYGDRLCEFAMSFGALAKVTLYVVDSKSNPVSNAQVLAWFWRGGGEQYDKQVITYTDENGYAVLNDKTQSHIIFNVIKDGYYNTRWEFHFVDRFHDCVERGRWLPWNPTLEVVLKEIRNPAPMNRKWIKKNIPVHTHVGFDFQAEDIVSPYGIGTHSDITLYFERSKKESPLVFSKHLNIRTSEQGGILQYKKDFFSEMPFRYEAPQEGFQSSISLEKVWVEHKLQKNKCLGDNEYWIVKSNADPRGEKVIIIDSFVFDESPKGPDYFSIHVGYLENPVLNSTSTESKVCP